MENTSGKWEGDMAQKLINDKISDHFANTDNIAVPYMISVTGIPGSGKSISSLLIKQHMEEEIKNNLALNSLDIQVL